MSDTGWIEAFFPAGTEKRNPEFDKLFDMVSAVADSFSNNSPPEDPQQLLDTMSDFAVANFSCRNQTPIHKCSTCDANAKTIDIFTENYTALLDQHKSQGPSEKLGAAFKQVISDWLRMHIMCIAEKK